MLPFSLVILRAGLKKTRELLPAILVSGISFAVMQWFTSNFLGPALPDVLAGICSILCLVIFLKFWKPKNIWRFPKEPVPTIEVEKKYTAGQIIRACSPFILLTIMIITWGMRPIKELLNSVGRFQFEFPVLHNVILDNSSKPLAHIFKFNYLSASVT